MGRQEILWVRGEGDMASDREQGAIRRLIAEIDSIDAWRDRVGRQIVILFIATFVSALGLLVWSVSHAQDIVKTSGPRVPGVIQSERAQVR
jgi:hypothetical protein